jgi:hypothetical protein
MSEYKYRLKNWMLLRDIMSGDAIFAEHIIYHALNEITKWPYSGAIAKTIEACKNTISQDGFELNFILNAQNMAPEFREHISIQYENFLIGIDGLLDEMIENVVKQHNPNSIKQLREAIFGIY